MGNVQTNFEGWKNTQKISFFLLSDIRQNLVLLLMLSLLLQLVI